VATVGISETVHYAAVLNTGQVVQAAWSPTAAYAAVLFNGQVLTGTITVSFINYGLQTLACTGTTQGTAAAITADTVKLTTSASNLGAILPATGGLRIEVHNSGPTLGANIYPPSGGSIDGLGTNVAYALALNAAAVFYTFDGSHYCVGTLQC